CWFTRAQEHHGRNRLVIVGCTRRWRSSGRCPAFRIEVRIRYENLTLGCGDSCTPTIIRVRCAVLALDLNTEGEARIRTLLDDIRGNARFRHLHSWRTG